MPLTINPEILFFFSDNYIMGTAVWAVPSISLRKEIQGWALLYVCWLGFILSFYILNMNLFESIIQAIIVALKLHHRSHNAHGELRDVLKKNDFDRD